VRLGKGKGKWAFIFVEMSKRNGGRGVEKAQDLSRLGGRRGLTNRGLEGGGGAGTREDEREAILMRVETGT